MQSIEFQNYSITDDTITDAMSPPKPASVSDAIKWINEKIKNEGIDPAEVKSLDLSHNNISLEGAAQILQYVTNELTGLVELNLSCNRIRDWQRGHDEYDEFEKALESVLQMPSLKKLDLRSNFLSNLDWYKYCLSKFPNDLMDKIYWK